MDDSSGTVTRLLAELSGPQAEEAALQLHSTFYIASLRRLAQRHLMNELA